MSTAVWFDDDANELADALGLPPTTRDFSLRIHMDEAVTLTTTRLVTLGEMEAVMYYLKKHEAVEAAEGTAPAFQTEVDE